MAILDQDSLARLLHRQDVADPGKYDPAYIAAVIADVADDSASFLGYDPVLQAVWGEEGTVSYVQSGSYVGRYALTLAHAPLIPGGAWAIFSQIALRYGLATLPDSAVSLDTVTVLHGLGRAFTLAPGAVEALTWQYGLSPGVQAVGFTANYVAGYATGINDPVPNGGGTGFTATAVLSGGQVASVTITAPGSGYTSAPLLIVLGGGGSGALLQASIAGGAVTGVSVLSGGSGYASVPAIGVDTRSTFNAPPMPANITQAAVLLCRERLALDDASNLQTTNASAGSISYIRTADQEVKYQSFSQSSTTGQSSSLGSGTAMSQAAARKLSSYRRVLLPLLV